MSQCVEFRLSRTYHTRVEPTARVQAIAAMFGIGIDESIEMTLYDDLPVRVAPGRVIYVTGDSGAGKSSFLRDLTDAARNDESVYVLPTPTVDECPDVPLVDQFGDDMTIAQIGQLLAYVGISEAFVYLRKPRELSDGQRYRFLLALMIHHAVRSEKPITLVAIDEFLAFLDRETARNVAYQTRRAATRHGLCVAVATTHQDLLDDLQPNCRINFQLALEPELTELPVTEDRA